MQNREPQILHEPPPLEPTGHPPSRWQPLTLAGGGLVCVIVALLVPIPYRGRAAVAIGDLVHAPLFGGLTLGVLTLWNRFSPILRNGWGMSKRDALVGLGVFAFGLSIEAVQSVFGRTGNVGDAINNGLGILAATLGHGGWQLHRRRLKSRLISRMFLATAGILLAIAWWIPVTLLRDVLAVHSDFPSLASFESNVQLTRFYFRESSARMSHQNVTEGSRSMEVTYQATPYPAATLVELNSDWSKMEALEVDVTLDASYPDTDARFMIKVIDQRHSTDHTDTYRGEWSIARGKTQRIRVSREEILQGPDTRVTDLNRIQFVDLVLLAPVETVKVRFDRLRLVVAPTF